MGSAGPSAGGPPDLSAGLYPLADRYHLFLCLGVWYSAKRRRPLQMSFEGDASGSPQANV